MSALRIGQRVKLVRPLYPAPRYACPPIGAEGVIVGTAENFCKLSAWDVTFDKPCPSSGWVFLSEELEPILDEGDFARFMEEVLKPVPVIDDEPLVVA